MAEKKKKKSRIKKIFKNLAKVAAIGTLGYGASKMFGGSKPSGFLKSGAAGGASLAGNRQALAKRLMTSNRAYTGSGDDEPIMTGGVGVKPARINAYDTVNIPRHSTQMQWGAKRGGRATGIAKRGFGRALMKGKK